MLVNVGGKIAKMLEEYAASIAAWMGVHRVPLSQVAMALIKACLENEECSNRARAMLAELYDKYGRPKLVSRALMQFEDKNVF